ncbi:MAG: hypothetical protein D6795_00135 [Deltaproteobacteria bacterium]|nr:MAG: hypothetical protein D6795_00135 [Deltaproteobacteria bacterium]
MSYRPTKRSRAEEGELVLDLVPYMNLLLIIIPVLLMTASYIQLSIIDVYLPAEAKPDAAQESEDPVIEPEAKLTLTIIITEDGFTVGGTGGILSSVVAGEEEGKDSGASVPRKDNGEYDYEKLGQILYSIKQAHPAHSSVILLANPTIPFETIVKVMDTSRVIEVDGKKITMFPNVAIAGEIL